MKIGFLLNSMGGGGSERAVSNLSNELSEQGHEVRIYLTNYKEMDYNINRNIKLIICPQEHNSCKVNLILKRVFYLRKSIKADSPEVLFAFSVYHIPYALLAKWNNRCKVVGTERSNPHIYGFFGKMIIKFFAQFCDGYIFQTERAKLCYPPKVQNKSFVIPNCVYAPIRKKEKKEGVNFCAAGRKEPNKDFATILRAFALLKNKDDITLTIYGKKDLRNDLEQMIKALAIEKNVVLKKFTPNLPEEITAYTAYIFSSKMEGMPNILMEAMAGGMPCIATDCEYGPRELIENYKNGILVPAGNPTKMAEAMEWMIANPNERNAMGKEAEKIVDVYSGYQIAKQYMNYGNSIKKYKCKDCERNLN